MADKNMNAKISVNFEESASRQSLNSGDSLPTLFGKTKKFFSDLKPVALTGSYNDLTDTPEFSTPVLNTTQGNPITITDGADAPLIGLTIYGNSVQDGTPTTANPISINSVGDDGTVAVMADNTDEITLSAIITSGLPLCSIGDYRDELIYNADGTGKIIKRIHKVVLDSSGEWKSSTTRAEGQTRFGFLLNEKPIYDDNYTDEMISLIMSEQYVSIPYKDTYRCIEGISVTHNTGNRIYIYDENFATATLDEWKAHLAENPLTVIYVLNTPQEIELSTDEMTALQKLQTFDGVTNVYNGGNAKMYIKYWCDDTIPSLLNMEESPDNSNGSNSSSTPNYSDISVLERIRIGGI